MRSISHDDSWTSTRAVCTHRQLTKGMTNLIRPGYPRATVKGTGSKEASEELGTATEISGDNCKMEISHTLETNRAPESKPGRGTPPPTIDSAQTCTFWPPSPCDSRGGGGGGSGKSGLLFRPTVPKAIWVVWRKGWRPSLPFFDVRPAAIFAVKASGRGRCYHGPCPPSAGFPS